MIDQAEGWQPAVIAPSLNNVHHTYELPGMDRWAKDVGKVVWVRPYESDCCLDFCPDGRTFELHPESVAMLVGSDTYLPFGTRVLCEHQIDSD